MNEQIAAQKYILMSLIQRLDEQSPGLLREMIEGAENDRDQSSPPEDQKEHVSKVFNEAITMLKFAENQLRNN